MDNRPVSPEAKAFQSAGVGGGVVVVTVVVDVVVGTVVVATVVVDVAVLVVVVAGAVVVEAVVVVDDAEVPEVEVVPPALCRLAPHAAPTAAKPPMAPIRRSRRRVRTGPASPIRDRVGVAPGRSPRWPYPRRATVGVAPARNPRGPGRPGTNGLSRSFRLRRLQVPSGGADRICPLARVVNERHTVVASIEASAPSTRARAASGVKRAQPTS